MNMMQKSYKYQIILCLTGLFIALNAFPESLAWIPYPEESYIDITPPSPSSLVGDGVIDEELIAVWDFSYAGCDPSHYYIYHNGNLLHSDDWEGETSISYSFFYSTEGPGDVTILVYGTEWGSQYTISGSNSDVSVGWYGPLGYP